MTGSGTLTSLGGASKTTVLAEEEFKVRVEFTVNATINKGQLAKLNAAGQVLPWTAADLQHTCIGYADSTEAAGALVTIVTRAYAILYAISTGATNAGIGMQTGYDSADAETSLNGAIGFNEWGAAADVTNTVGWIIDPATAANQLMRVLVKD